MSMSDFGALRLLVCAAACCANILNPSAFAQTAAETTAPAAGFSNPVDIDIADPHVLRTGGKYYLYGTTSPSRGFIVYVSDDLVRWTNAGFCYRKSDESWADRDFWAPEVTEKDGAFYLHYSAKNTDENIRNICMAKSSSPLGPFEDVKGPMFPGRSINDSHIYRDPDTGKAYMYAAEEGRNPNEIIVAELSDSLLETVTTPTACLLPGQAWEKNTWIEAPFVVREAGWLYMLYSGNAFWEPEYAIGYATAKHPLGPWTKHPANPVLGMTDQVHGPGHCSVIGSPDGSEQFVVYHRHTAPGKKSRVMALDRMRFVADGENPPRMTFPGAPSHTPQRPPSATGGK